MNEYIDHVKMFQNGLLQTKASTAKVNRIQYGNESIILLYTFLDSFHRVKHSSDGTKLTII